MSEEQLGTLQGKIRGPENRLRASARELASWQRTVLPTMQAMLIGLTLFFFVATLRQLYFLQSSILQGGTTVTSASVPNLLADAAHVTSQERLNAAHLQTLFELESYVLGYRYHHANVLLMSSVWVRYLGFVTGMILALVGAAFVLGRLETQPAALNGNISELQWQVQSSSPGLIMVVLGVVLMLATVIMQHSFSVRDNPVFLRASLPTVDPLQLGNGSVPDLPLAEPTPLPEAENTRE